MADESFPIGPEELTAEWLTAALRDAGCLGKGDRVISLAAERVGQGVGFVGQIARITPEYDPPAPPGAPATIICKFPAGEPAGRRLAAAYGFYRCEVNFYRHIAGGISLRTPQCYFSAMNDDASEFVLLLEDLGASGRLGDQVAGCSLDDARLAMRKLGSFHASWWRRPDLDGLGWLPFGLDLGRLSLKHMYPLGWKPALESYGHLIPGDLRDAAPTLNERLLTAIERLEDGPLTIMHADYRLDNMFFGTPSCGYDFAVIDWQIANRGWPAYDVAYFMGSNLEPEVRRAHEEPLLRTYHDALTAGGVADYAWEQFREDYVLSMLAYLANMIGNVTSLDMANERGVALFELIFRRVATAASDLHALDALG